MPAGCGRRGPTDPAGMAFARSGSLTWSGGDLTVVNAPPGQHGAWKGKPGHGRGKTGHGRGKTGHGRGKNGAWTRHGRGMDQAWI